jgi:hypothetical protein
MDMDFNDFSVDISAFQAKRESKWESYFRGAGVVVNGVGSLVVSGGVSVSCLLWLF